MNNVIDSLGGRKFVLSVIGIVTLFVMVIVKIIDVKEFVTFLTIQIGTYQASNAVASLTQK